MKKLITFSIVFALIALKIVAQTSPSPFKVSYTAPFDYVKNAADVGLFGNENDGYVKLHFHIPSTNSGWGYENTNLYILSFDNKLNYKKTTEINVKKFPDTFMPEAFVYNKKKLFFIYSVRDGKKGPSTISFKEIDLKTGDLSATETKLIAGVSIDVDFRKTGMIDLTKRQESHSMVIVRQSPDSSKVLFAYKKEGPESKNDHTPLVVGFYVFDSDFKPLWNKETELPAMENDAVFSNFFVDNDGNAYSQITVIGNKKASNDDERNGHKEILYVSDKGNNVSHLSLKFPDKKVRELNLTQDKKGQLYVAGLYSKKADQPSGFYLSKIDKDKSQLKINPKYFDIPADMILANKSDKDKKKINEAIAKGEEATADYLGIYDFKILDDGSALIVGEQSYSQEHRSQIGNSIYITQDYFTKDIYLLKADANGNQSWMKKIPKNQAEYATAYEVSYSMIEINKEFYFFYTDNLKNMNPDLNKEPELSAPQNKRALMLSKVDANGNITKVKIASMKEDDYKCEPKFFQLQNSGAIVGEVYHSRSERQMIKLEKQ